MAALWGDNHERDIRDAQSLYFWNMVRLVLLFFAFVLFVTSPFWLWFLFNNQTVTETRFNKTENLTDEERRAIGESLRARERQTEEWNRKHFGVK